MDRGSKSAVACGGRRSAAPQQGRLAGTRDAAPPHTAGRRLLSPVVTGSRESTETAQIVL